MEQTLLDTFEGMKMTDRQKNLFADVMVDRIQLYRNKKLMCVNLKSSHIIPYREIRLVRHNLEAVMGPVGFSVRVDDRYNLSKQYRPEDFWKEYQDSIMEILKEDNILDFNILYRGQAEMNGSMLTVTCEDDSMYRARQDKLTRRLQEIFEDKAGFHIEVEINYTEASTLEAPSPEYEYVRLEHRPQQKPAAGSDGNGTAAAPEHNSEVPWDDGAAAEGKKNAVEINRRRIVARIVALEKLDDLNGERHLHDAVVRCFASDVDAYQTPARIAHFNQCGLYVKLRARKHNVVEGALSRQRLH